MKFKMICIVSLILLTVITIGGVSAADNNVTDNVLNVEDAQNDELSLEQSNSEQIIENDSNYDIKSDKELQDVLGKCDDNESILTTDNADSKLTSSIAVSNIISALKVTSTKQIATKTTTKKKTTTHYVKVGIYKGKLTNAQYKKLKSFYKNNKKYKFVSIKSTNKKYHKITIQYFNGYNGQNGKYYKKGFYATVWDTRYGMDRIKIVNKRVRI